MSEAFIPAAPATPDLQITVPGFGTGSVAELAHHIAHLKDERETMQAERDAARNACDAAMNPPIVTLFERIIQNMVEIHFDGPGADQLERMVDSAVEMALENATVDVEAYIRP